MIFQMFAECHPGNYGGAVSRAGAGPHRGTAKFAAAGLVLMLSAVVSAPVKAGQPTGLRSETDGKAFRRIAIRTDAGRSIRLADAAAVPAGGRSRYQTAVRPPRRFADRRPGDPARSDHKGLSTLSWEKSLPGRPCGDRRNHQRPLSRGRLSPEPRDRSSRRTSGTAGFVFR